MADVFLVRVERRPPRFELRDRGVLIGTLRYTRRPRPVVVAETDGGGWQLDRAPLFKADYPILALGGRREVGRVHERRWTWRASVDFELDGLRCELRGVSVRRFEWALTAVGGETLHMTISGRTARRLGPIAVDHPGLVLMGFHLMMSRMRHKPRGAAAGAAGG